MHATYIQLKFTCIIGDPKAANRNSAMNIPRVMGYFTHKVQWNFCHVNREN